MPNPSPEKEPLSVLNSPDAKHNRHARLLVVDDNLSIRSLYASYLRDHYNLTIASNGQEAFDLAKKHQFDLYITDLIMPGIDGITLIQKIRTIHPDAGVIVVSETEEIDVAIGAFRQRPLEFLRKPIKKNLLISSIERNLDVMQLKENFQHLSRESSADPGCPEPVWGVSPVMQTFWDKARRVAEMDLSPSILVSGESGCGKEVVARQLHRWSPRKSHPFFSINCGLLSRELAASELLGVAKGVATGVEPRKGKFEVADKGTLFLDEIAELPIAVQPMLLRVLQEKVVTPVGAVTEVPVDVRIVAATNKDLGQCVADGTFREDLFYRLNVVHLHIPPLRHRKDDIPGLLYHLYLRHGGRGPQPISDEEMADWMSYSWPGNVRQLENALINRLIMGRPIDPGESAAQPLHRRSGILDLNEPIPWEDIKYTVFKHAIDAANGNVREAARRLGIAKSTLWEYCQKQGLIA
ncbi:sigma-54-dependent Fis family transcriptional regulator [bacterium]|nr:sigma-54-dependent Fis family transcriptional regulator [candidate division CSSED10-310 bacterium]